MFTHHSDASILVELGNRIAQNRLNSNITQKTLAKQAGVSHRTITRIESGASVQFTNIIRVLRALDLVENLDTCIPETPDSPLQKLKLKKSRQRASKLGTKTKPTTPWTWDEKL